MKLLDSQQSESSTHTHTHTLSPHPTTDTGIHSQAQHARTHGNTVGIQHTVDRGTVRVNSDTTCFQLAALESDMNTQTNTGFEQSPSAEDEPAVSDMNTGDCGFHLFTLIRGHLCCQARQIKDYQSLPVLTSKESGLS